MSNRELGWLIVILGSVALVVVGTAIGLIFLDLWDRREFLSIGIGLVVVFYPLLAWWLVWRSKDGRN